MLKVTLIAAHWRGRRKRRSGGAFIVDASNDTLHPAWRRFVGEEHFSAKDAKDAKRAKKKARKANAKWPWFRSDGFPLRSLRPLRTNERATKPAAALDVPTAAIPFACASQPRGEFHKLMADFTIRPRRFPSCPPRAANEIKQLRTWHETWNA